MKLSAFRWSYWNRRGGNSSNSFRSLDPSFDGGFFSVAKSSPCSVFWLVIHGLCCLISLILGFRFSHLVLFFLFSTSVTNLYTTPLLLTAGNDAVNHLLRLKPLETGINGATMSMKRKMNNSRVVVGRHGIRIRPWPHPNPIEVMKANRILERVQKEQRSMFGVRNRDRKTVIAVTPTYVRTFQALHLTGVMHSLMLVPYDLVWIVVEAGGKSNETASLLAKSGLTEKTIHLGFDFKMPNTWEDRHKLETKMRIHALRTVREKKIDGIVVFVDDSNMHSMELFDEIQSVKWFGALSIGILAHSGNADSVLTMNQEKHKEMKKKPSSRMPIQGPKCDDSTEKLIGWRVFDTQPYAKKNEEAYTSMTMNPSKMEWSGFVLNSKLLWKDEKPEWVKDINLDDDEEIDSPLSLVKDASMVEPLGSCGRNVLLWWLRVEARADSKFPPQWIIDSPLEITVPSKRTPWLPKNGQRRGGTKSKSSKGKQEQEAI